MVDKRTRRDAGDDIANDVELVDTWAAELTALAYGAVASPHGVIPVPAVDSTRAPHLTLISSTDEPVSISSPDEPILIGNSEAPIPARLPDRQIFDMPVSRGGAVVDATVEQLARDIVAITQARDALNGAETMPPPVPARPVRPAIRGQTQAPMALSAVMMTWVPSGLRRTADSVPIILGSVLGFLMITVFSIAAVFIKFAR
jgi:hypothetical protein